LECGYGFVDSSNFRGSPFANELRLFVGLGLETFSPDETGEAMTQEHQEAQPAPQAEAVQAQALEVPDRDWLSPLDENCYQNKCMTCGNLYLGYKRSFECKACAGTLASASDAAQTDSKLLEHIAQQWDGCMYEAVGETIDIGQAIREAVRLYGKESGK
jgi:hypothetical protein